MSRKKKGRESHKGWTLDSGEGKPHLPSERERQFGKGKDRTGQNQARCRPEGMFLKKKKSSIHSREKKKKDPNYETSQKKKKKKPVGRGHPGELSKSEGWDRKPEPGGKKKGNVESQREKKKKSPKKKRKTFLQPQGKTTSRGDNGGKGEPKGGVGGTGPNRRKLGCRGNEHRTMHHNQKQRKSSTPKRGPDQKKGKMLGHSDRVGWFFKRGKQLGAQKKKAPSSGEGG